MMKSVGAAGRVCRDSNLSDEQIDCLFTKVLHPENNGTLTKLLQGYETMRSGKAEETAIAFTKNEIAELIGRSSSF